MTKGYKIWKHLLSEQRNIGNKAKAPKGYVLCSSEGNAASKLETCNPEAQAFLR